MKKYLLLITILFFSHLCLAESKWDLNPTKDEINSSGVYIPEDLRDSFSELNRMLTSELKLEILNGSERDLSQYHMGLGMWMRNNWSLWGESRLSKWFNSNKITHPDDMSGIIIKSYYRHLRGDPINFEEQAKKYIRYWAIRRKPTEIPCKEGVWMFGLNHSIKGEQIQYHLFDCGNGKYLSYDLDSDWNTPTKQMLDRINVLKDTNVISAPLIGHEE